MIISSAKLALARASSHVVSTMVGPQRNIRTDMERGERALQKKRIALAINTHTRATNLA